MNSELPERCSKLTITYLQGGYTYTHTGWVIQQGRRIIDRNTPHRTVCYIEQIMKWKHTK